MENKIVVTSPVAYYSSGVSSAVDKGATAAVHGGGVCGNPALIYNLIQFMMGAPVVDYNSLVVTPASTVPTGQITLIDTSRRYVDRLANEAVTNSSAFSYYSDNTFSGASYPSGCLLYTSPSPRDRQKSRMPSSA